MPRRLFRNRDYKNFEKAIDQAHEELGREIQIYIRGSGEDCPDCDWDSINEVSMNPNCTTCNGLGKIYPDIIRRINDVTVRFFDGSIVWDRTSAGRYEEGDALISVKLSKVLTNPLDVSSETYFDQAYKVVIDKVNYEVKSPAHRKGLNRPYLCRVKLSRTE